MERTAMTNKRDECKHGAALGELLAVIHRDGGHYIEKHGWEKAVEDAIRVYLRLLSDRENLEAKVRERIDELGKAVDPHSPLESMCKTNEAAALKWVLEQMNPKEETFTCCKCGKEHPVSFGLSCYCGRFKCNDCWSEND